VVYLLAARADSPLEARCDDVHSYLMATLPAQFAGVTVVTKANVYFDGKVVSHSVLFADGSKKTLGLIYAGSYHFGTDAAERMEIVAGSCKVTLDGQTVVKTYGAGEYFDVPAKSGFTIEVASGIAEYICSFLK
jgi:purine/pyrimidine-nucleoside phosphorylase